MSTVKRRDVPEVKNVVGYGAFVRIKHDPEGFDSLSFGQEGEPKPDLLARRGRLTLFTTREACKSALESTISEARAASETWLRGVTFRIIPIVGDAR